jgi:hypothetical protein
MGQQLRLLLCDLFESLFQDLRDPCVELLAAALE